MLRSWAARTWGPAVNLMLSVEEGKAHVGVWYRAFRRSTGLGPGRKSRGLRTGGRSTWAITTRPWSTWGPPLPSLVTRSNWCARTCLFTYKP